MPKLGYQELYDVVTRAGWPENERVKAVAVAMATSGGRTDVPGGLFALPGPPSLDPVANAKGALALRQSRGWSAWTAVNSGAYLLYQVQAEQFAKKKTPTTPEKKTDPGNSPWIPDFIEGPTDAVGNGVGAALDFANAARLWVTDPHSWERVAKVVIGGTLVVVGLVLMVGPSRVTSAATMVLPVGKAVKAVGAVGATKGGK